MNNNDWYIEDWYPSGHRIMDTAVEGSCKTMLGCWLAICTATGTPFFGQAIKQGSVLIIDEETPIATLDDKLQRFAQGLNIKDWHTLPITIHSMEGYRFGRRTSLNWLLKMVMNEKYQLLRMDSVLAMLPGYRQGLVENDSSVGIALKDDLDKILSFVSNISISAHSKKAVAEMGLAQIKASDMQLIVRGSGSIVGEAADTGIVIKKISEHPLRFVIITKARRKAVPMTMQDVYVELVEESYGQGWARLERIEPIVLPPSPVAKALFGLFKPGGEVSAQHIVRSAAFYTRNESRFGIEELIDRKVILNDNGAFTFRLNPLVNMQCEEHYWKALIEE